MMILYYVGAKIWNLYRKFQNVLEKFFWKTCAKCMNLLNSNQIFHYKRCITPKRVMSWLGPSDLCYCTRATQLLSKKCHSRGEPLATLYPTWQPEIWTSNLPLQRWKLYRSTEGPVRVRPIYINHPPREFRIGDRNVWAKCANYDAQLLSRFCFVTILVLQKTL